MQHPSLILASTSPYRRQLLQQLGMDFIWVAPQLEETTLPGEPPIETARRLAREKAGAVFAEHKHAVVIGSDQVADLDGQALGKPLSEEKAFEQLGACSGRTLWFHTGVAVISARGTDTEVISTRVEFRQMSERQIHSYIKEGGRSGLCRQLQVRGLGHLPV